MPGDQGSRYRNEAVATKLVFLSKDNLNDDEDNSKQGMKQVGPVATSLKFLGPKNLSNTELLDNDMDSDDSSIKKFNKTK